MKLKDGFVVRKIAKQFMAIPVGARTQEIHGMVGLNETGAFLWEALKTPKTEEELVDALLAEYEVEREQAAEAVKRFVDMLREEELLESEEN